MKPKFYPEDTIAAIATPLGRGAIGVIKISGERSLTILQRIFYPFKKPKTFESHRFYYGFIKDPESGAIIDEVLVVYMKKPFSYTREDVVEIHAHSGYFNLKKILDLVLREGARPAEPGEFTFRAYLNGRIDLTQAEAIEEIVSAKSEISLNLALKNLSGKLSEKIQKLREDLLFILAQVESAIDFPEEDIEILNPPELRALIEKVISEVYQLIENYREGKIYREGITLVISGKPNVGKSSLMNALLREERAIVTPIPGTTRDFLEEEAYIKGLPVKLIDTAGLRDTEDVVEKIGVERALQKLKEADLVLFLVDAGCKPTEEDIKLYSLIKNYPHLVVVNKIDLPENYLQEWDEVFSTMEIEHLPISVKEHKNLDKLAQKIFDRITQEKALKVPEVAPNLRQKTALEKAVVHLKSALEELHKKEPLSEILAVELREALADLAEIIGEVTTEDLLSDIFSRFCIGK
ncbi:MAG: tRNA uridine-5-carboxymethylaminomethyl(34) synthesis GTPase MnmE [Caldimicrobium sp.]|nr:tRNA uridine-5-carboxymethylaminomethyl(34) synthesis GTPase MnmE [Caldimicrobium sp.]MCX7873339.1 tRNA uridine-5-carboxymethylaminomethyl(34) synthesis GTPase MnmE [Caldimicrobium sp.]MDW8093423.1 tRNA uridine-5-carboxymethylaminomethyl(34) synthesis GTPase MnmE [Caldimicrobium sp.]